MCEAVIHQNCKNLPNMWNPQCIFALGWVMWHWSFIAFSACLSHDFTVFYSKFKLSLPLLTSDTSLSGLVPLSDVSLILLPPLMNASDSNCLSNCLVGFLSTTSRNQLHIHELLFYWQPIHLLSYFLGHVFQPSQLYLDHFQPYQMPWECDWHCTMSKVLCRCHSYSKAFQGWQLEETYIICIYIYMQKLATELTGLLALQWWETPSFYGNRREGGSSEGFSEF